MGKAKKRKLVNSSKNVSNAKRHPLKRGGAPTGGGPAAAAVKQNHLAPVQAAQQKKKTKKKEHGQGSGGGGGGEEEGEQKLSQHQRPTIPFEPDEKILLVGEGDFSFAHSLLTHHACTSLTATSFDSLAEVLEKYPQAEVHMAALRAKGMPVLHGVDARKLAAGKEIRKAAHRPRWDGGSYDGDVDGGVARASAGAGAGAGIRQARQGDEHEGFDVVIFNFPHVGGVTKDVNRQVRYNQDRRLLTRLADDPIELLVSFFTSSMPLLYRPSSASPPTQHNNNDNNNNNKDTKHARSQPQGRRRRRRPPGRIITTTFTSPPYTLWNIRDLARHAGLKVLRSFGFQAAAYPGYRHARTLGNVGGVEGGGAWRGEERESRSYVFGFKEGEYDGLLPGEARSRKRKKGASEDDDDDDDDDDDGYDDDDEDDEGY
ncbi:MAG: hypothetical protein M1819_007213 [Sarea resinae]|nr:MAG: hypothetical protein M1819_007213 [Sarea resinae]